MALPPLGTVAIAVVLCAGCFALVAWVWAKVLDDRSRSPQPPRRRGVGTGQLVVVPLLLLASVFSARRVPALGEPGSGLQLQLAAAVAMIAALFLFDRDLRRRAGDARDVHRLTAWGVAAIGAVLLAVGLGAAAAGVATGDPWVPVQASAVLLGVGALAVLDLRLALALQRRWERRRTGARERLGPTPRHPGPGSCRRRQPPSRRRSTG